MKTPLETRGSRANDGKSARLGKKQPDGTHAHRIAHVQRIRPAAPGPGTVGRALAPRRGPTRAVPGRAGLVQGHADPTGNTRITMVQRTPCAARPLFNGCDTLPILFGRLSHSFEMHRPRTKGLFRACDDGRAGLPGLVASGTGETRS